MPTGGVTLENARLFLAAGAGAVGIGTALVDAKSVEAGNWEALETRARAHGSAEPAGADARSPRHLLLRDLYHTFNALLGWLCKATSTLLHNPP
jgi:hypothetical protein